MGEERMSGVKLEGVVEYNRDGSRVSESTYQYYAPRFRAWDPINGCMHTVSYIDFNKSLLGSYGCKHDENAINNIPLEKVILLSCSGFVDKDNRPIYEGDIVRAKSVHEPDGEYRNEVVQFMRGVFGIQGKYAALGLDKDVMRLLSFELEVLGNVYENPELLENNNG